jgi:hypothetical protein
VAVAGISLATRGTSPPITVSTATLPTAVAGQTARDGLALQGSFVKVVRSISPSVVQIEDQEGLGSGIVLDDAATSSRTTTSSAAGARSR